MHLPDFVLLLMGTIAAIAAGLGAAVLALESRRFKVVRVLFWISALSFGSMGVIWSQTSHGYPLLTQMIVAGVCAALAAGALVWGLNEVRIASAASTEMLTQSTVKKPYEANRIGDVTDNFGVVSQGQAGDNTK